jgi:hypothetical protein
VADPAIVLVLLLAGDAGDPATQAILPAARRPLGEDTVMLVQQSETTPTDEEAFALARQVHALSAVSLAWEDPAHTRVRLRVFLVEGARRYDYELAFDPRDAPAERGRAIGLAMTPVLTRAIASAHLSEPQAGPPDPAPGSAPTASPLDAASLASATRSAYAPSPAISSSDAPPRLPYGPTRSLLALDVMSSGTVGIGGNALAIGPMLGVRAFVVGPFALHVVGLARLGTVDAASASAATLGVGGGVAWRALRTGEGAHALALGARVDILAMQHALTQDDAGVTVRRSRWLTAFDVVAEGAWPLARHLDIVVGVGGEVASGPTEITVGGRPADHIPVGRGIAELGVHVPF